MAVRVLYLTHGEATTLGATVNLAEVRAGEMRAAAAVLGLGEVVLLGYPDGGPADISLSVLDSEAKERLGGADLLVVFEPGGVTGHPDHRAATAGGQPGGRPTRVSVLEVGGSARRGRR